MVTHHVTGYLEVLAAVAWVPAILGQHHHGQDRFCLHPSVSEDRYLQKAVQVLQSNSDTEGDRITPGGAYFSNN